jgi:hypothetical protein
MGNPVGFNYYASGADVSKPVAGDDRHTQARSAFPAADSQFMTGARLREALWPGASSLLLAGRASRTPNGLSCRAGVLSRIIGLSYMAGMPETCRPGSSHGNQMARTPTATSTTPTAWPNGLP